MRKIADIKPFRKRKQMIERKFLNGLLYTCKFLCNMARDCHP